MQCLRTSAEQHPAKAQPAAAMGAMASTEWAHAEECVTVDAGTQTEMKPRRRSRRASPNLMDLRVARSVFAVAEVLGGRHLPQPAAPAAPAAPDDDDWARRNAKRRALIRAVKSKPEFQAALDRGEDGTCCGIEPDPDDSTVSKRAWELRTTVWRQTLRQKANMPSPLKNPIRSGETLKTYAFAAQRPIPVTVDASV